MRSRLLWAVLLGTACLAPGRESRAQTAAIEAVPAELLPQERRDLDSMRASLLDRRQTLLQSIQSHNGKCASVPEDSPLVAQCSADQAALEGEIARYREALAEYDRLLAERLASARERRARCQDLSRRAESERDRIEALRRSVDLSAEELAEWTRANGEAQKGAVLASVTFVLDEYSAGLDELHGSVSKLESEAERIARRAEQSRKFETRMRYVAQLHAIRTEWNVQWARMMGKELARTGLEAKDTWELARNTMHHEFRVARSHDAAIRETLAEPGFREAFVGEDLDTPGLDVLSALAQKAGEDAAKLELGLARYEKFTGPSVRAAVFVRDALYSALASGLSTARVLQENEVAGSLAKGAASLQKQYAGTVKALRACRSP